jgi:tetratricopeptide (TPR) repeat protein
MFPSGVFVSSDSGRSWSPLSGNGDAGWLTGDLMDLHTGVLAGRNGLLAFLRGGEIERLPNDHAGLCSYLNVRLGRGHGGWLVGEGGAVLCTSDRGLSWHPPAGELPPAARWFDFSAVAWNKMQCWVAGSPGTRVFYTADAGQTWAAFPTGSFAPLRAMTFVDDSHGWAVGDLGTILVTSDAGRTWQKQQSGGTRAAILGFFGDSENVPLEMFAKLGGNEGYLAAVNILGRRDLEIPPNDYVPLADRIQEAVVRVGGVQATVAWQFPLRQAGLPLSSEQIVEAWNRVHDDRGLESLRDYVMRQICLWRPEVIVTENASRPDDEPLLALVQQAVLQGMIRAANPDNFTDALAETGLKPWTVRRVFAVLPSGMRSEINISTVQFSPHLGGTLADVSVEPRGLLVDQPTIAPPMVAFHPLASNVPQDQDPRDLFSGVTLPHGGEARREILPKTSDKFNDPQQTAQKRRYVQAILAQAERKAWSSEQMLAQVNELTHNLDDASSGFILYQLGDSYCRTNRWTHAAEIFQIMVERHPNHALTPAALLWLVQYYGSEEAAWRAEPDASQHAKRYEHAVELAKEVERTRPELFAEPQMQMPLASAYRNLNQRPQAVHCYHQQNRGNKDDPWCDCAQNELFILESKGHPSKPILSCIRAEAKPHLDGKLDDPIWQKAKSVSLQSAQHDDAEWPAEVLLAYDSEFLYLAGRCKQTASTRQALPPPSGSRSRDGDLSAHDRIQIFLDADRDFTTFYHLAVDERGWTNDRWWNEAAWNPTWYVASDRTEDGWTFEAAIAWSLFMGRAPQPRETWAVGIQRVVPGLGFQSWSNPASIKIRPEGFGYLVFE